MVTEPQDPNKALQLYTALRYFSTLGEIQPVAEWLAQELGRLDSANRRETVDVEFRQRQGACQTVEKLLNMVSEAKTKIDQLEEKRRRSRT